MKWSTLLSVTLAGLMGAGCGEGFEPEQQELSTHEAALEESVSEEARQDEATNEVWVKGCWYRVSMRTRFPPFPPHQLLSVERMPSIHCEAASVQLEQGYQGMKPLLTTRAGELAIAWTRRGTPSGSARAQVKVFHVAPETLAVERTAWLILWSGGLTASDMRFEGHRLVLDTDAGPVTLPHFLTSEEPPQGLPRPPWM